MGSAAGGGADPRIAPVRRVSGLLGLLWLVLAATPTGAQSARQVKVVRVNDDSPADVAGLQAGDRILRIDGTAVRSLDQLWTTLWRNGPPEREVKLDIQREGKSETVKVFTVERAKTLKRAQGV